MTQYRLPPEWPLSTTARNGSGAYAEHISALVEQYYYLVAYHHARTLSPGCMRIHEGAAGGGSSVLTTSVGVVRAPWLGPCRVAIWYTTGAAGDSVSVTVDSTSEGDSATLGGGGTQGHYGAVGLIELELTVGDEDSQTWTQSSLEQLDIDIDHTTSDATSTLRLRGIQVRQVSSGVLARVITL